MVVGRKAGRLQHEHVLAAHVFQDLDEDLVVREAADVGPDQRQGQLGGNGFCQRAVAVAGENLHIATPAAGRFLVKSLI